MNKQLLSVQCELNAPKNQYNSFGKYNYRSLEDITAAVKPLLKKYEANLIMRDEIVLVGERYYIKATAIFSSADGEVEVTAFAREAAEKKGMDDSQITGTASSYARKYALNGLFAIDDTKDADTDEYKNQGERGGKGTGMPKSDKNRSQGRSGASGGNRKALIAFIKENNLDMNELTEKYKLVGATEERFGEVLEALKIQVTK